MDLNRLTNKRYYDYPGSGDELNPLLNATAEHRRRVKAMRWALLFGLVLGTLMVFLIAQLIYSGGENAPIEPPSPPATVNLTSEVLTDPLVGANLKEEMS